MEDEITKRDLVAAIIFAGMHANSGDGDERYAVIQADRLIEELNKKGNKNEKGKR
jgi:mannose-1-phosphate guanylyltransferase